MLWLLLCPSRAFKSSVSAGTRQPRAGHTAVLCQHGTSLPVSHQHLCPGTFLRLQTETPKHKHHSVPLKHKIESDAQQPICKTFLRVNILGRKFIEKHRKSEKNTGTKEKCKTSGDEGNQQKEKCREEGMEDCSEGG